MNALPERIRSKIDAEGDCWNWTAYRDRLGYGRVSFHGQCRIAHRIVYEMLVGPIAEGLCIDHLCRNRACVNPAHLEAVTQLENVRRGDVAAAARRRGAEITHCVHGHAYTPANTRLEDGRKRHCRACARIRKAAARCSS